MGRAVGRGLRERSAGAQTHRWGVEREAQERERGGVERAGPLPPEVLARAEVRGERRARLAGALERLVPREGARDPSGGELRPDGPPLHGELPPADRPGGARGVRGLRGGQRGRRGGDGSASGVSSVEAMWDQVTKGACALLPSCAP